MKFFTSLPRWFLWGLVLPLIILNGWALLLLLNYFQGAIAIFLTAMLLAFVLNYPVRLLQRLKISRNLAVLIVLLVAIALLAIFGVTVVPALISQVNELANRLPTWIDSGSEQLQIFQTWAASHQISIDVSKLITQLEERLSNQLQTLSATVLNFLLDAIGSILNLVLTIVLTFYLLLHGEKLWNGIFQWFPSQIGAQIRQALRQNFQNYFIGQITLALLMGVSMTTAFVIIQLPFGLLFGLAVGLMALFPFGAAFGITVVSLLTALKSFWLGLKVLVMATIIDQAIENGIAPQLMGGFTGLNPVWILLSLLVGVKVGGLLGLVLAVPLASSLKSIVDMLHTPKVQRASANPIKTGSDNDIVQSKIHHRDTEETKE
ncbi:AI-2E family transporter [Planktothricoides raciborskii]|uniref:AI-2E family transporter n=1 Tax=Planktothricoides raciborskii FACHB-1370 TaxID=2949576 RepID=A0ABR8EDF3_9CYAN|nr:AI-2E family transporter [Planktothricoides raciborskii]MBD2543617.1 AI-2E family transporter [Planktothricoides raciborskii FACHB-1370]MBD2581306.1 AI-2E family transporter [Planktothricoides raciborskii FACHB-1261]